jgi:hypothetical protein
MNSQEYRTNRASFPREELVKYGGRWVAFSCDGRRVLAAEADLEQLGEWLTEHGQDLQEVVFEYLPSPGDDATLDRVESL